jgi:hypothetical protein
MQPSAATGERSRLLDIRRRSGNQNDTAFKSDKDNRADGNNPAGPESPSTRRFGAARRSLRGGADSNPAGPSLATGDDQRNRISEVRKRLGGQTRNDVPGATNQPKLSEDLNLIGQPPADRRLPGVGKLNAAGEQRLGPLPPQSTVLPQEVLKSNVPYRLKSGDLRPLTSGETAKKLKLADQYTLWAQGDVARRLDLQRHVHDLAAPIHSADLEHANGILDRSSLQLYHANFYQGLVSPTYVQHCLRFPYWGPAFFAGLCWYPNWTPWVEWSWYHHCHPLWDPRPIWCRPVLYDPCSPWAYWAIPAWTPLPVVACGTWVDVKPVLAAVAQVDLELLAVRFVDPGHPEENLGPRYRVWFRNNSNQPVTRPFAVVLMAGSDANLAAGLPQAGVRVTSIEANDVQSVDIRLPIKVLAMARDAAGKPAPFSALHVLVDANRELADTARANNGARLSPAEILPVDPAAFELQPVLAAPGAEVLLAGEGFGPQPGQVLLVVNGKEVEAEILGWYDLGVRFTLPRIVLPGPVDAEVIAVRGDGAASNPLKIRLAP